jgi:hypothetical protein
MPAKIRIYGKEATFAQGHWTCDDDSLQAMLQSMVDPRASASQAAEDEHAVYAAGRFGGLILTELGWQPAAHPEPEIRLEDFAPRKNPERAGWLSWMKKKR